MNHKRIAVVGGGAAGLMAAIAAAEGGGQVTLLEPNDRLGKKLNITGKGRCNVTNNCSREELLQNIPRNGRFLYGAFARFDSRDAMAFFEKLGVPLKTERGNRVFPQSDCAFDVSGALRRRCERLGVRWVRDRAVSVDTDGGRVCGVTGQQGTYPAEAVILATGGVSYPGTGSTGDGYRMAAALGHEIVPPCGSLVPLVSGDDACRRMQGLALKNVELTALNGKNKVQFRDFGELLFTHFGVSGPLVLSASAHLRHWDREQYRLSIDLKPALDREKLEARILRDLGENPNRDFEKILAGTPQHGAGDTGAAGDPGGAEGQLRDQGPASGPGGAAEGLHCVRYRAETGGGSHRHLRRREGEPGAAVYHGIKADPGALFCRGNTGC